MRFITSWLLVVVWAFFVTGCNLRNDPCVDVECGPNCGDCGDGLYCKYGRCEAADCLTIECGGGCGDCLSDQSCINGFCVSSNCNNVECGLGCDPCPNGSTCVA